jgi:transposase
MPRNSPMLTDGQWLKIEPLLPQLRSGKRGGRPWADSRRVLEGILWIARNGARWQDLPSAYPSPSTCWRRLRDWEEREVWLRIWRTFLGELNRKGRLDWSEAFIDGSFASAKKGALESERPSGARAQSGWWWSMARVFLWESTWNRPRRPRSPSRKPRSLRSASPTATVVSGRGRSRKG